MAISRVRNTGLGVAILAVVSIAPIAAGEPEGLCPRLGTLERVSYKGQEPKLFRELVRIVEAGPADAPTADRVARTFVACLERFKQGDAEPAASRVSAALGEDGGSLAVRVDAVGPKSFEVRSDPAQLARRVVAHLARAAPPEVRDELSNQLWFLWIESYLRATGNRHNHYAYASELIEERAEDRGRSFAVGFEVDLADGRILVSSVHDAALRTGGLTTGHEIVSLDGASPSDMNLPEIQRYWFSPEPFPYELVARKDGEHLELSASSVPTRHTTMAWSIRRGTGYVRLRGFSAGSLIELRRAVRALKTRRAERIVLDLRHNPGGTVTAGLVDLFFKPGQTVMSYQDHDADEPVDVDATVEYLGLPAAVLVDRDTASMAETLAAAFVSHERGPVVGETTAGKGVGQSLHAVLDEGRVSLVERTYFYPGKRDSWNGSGVAPTLEVPIDDEARERLRPFLESPVVRLDDQWDLDPVFQAAERHLKE